MTRRIGDRIAIIVLGASVVLILAILVVIVGNIVLHGAKTVTWEFISQPPRDGLTAGGILPAIVGTAALVILMSLAAVPLGVATAIYLHEYTPAEGLDLAWRRFRVSKGRPGRKRLFFRAMSAMLATITRSAVANLAGVPSIVFGLFGLGFFIQFIGRSIDRATQPPGEVVVGSAHYSALFFMGTLLFVITFLSNTTGQWVIRSMKRRM
ncbi:MAG TPA: hypothetical protein VHL59_13195, partial [Thermoanaerobaculia bacterium]|nr:hypothetical protein [Thermoanaerobaculia bacterium]